MLALRETLQNSRHPQMSQTFETHKSQVMDSLSVWHTKASDLVALAQKYHGYLDS